MISLEPEVERECVDYLIQTYHFFYPNHQNWAPMEQLRNLDLVRHLLHLVSQCTDWHSGIRVEVLKLILDLLHVMTVSPKVQLDLCETITIRGTPVQGVG